MRRELGKMLDKLFIMDGKYKGKLGKLKLECIFTPPTARSQGALVYVLRSKEGFTIFRWMSSGRFTDEIAVTDEWKLYNFIKSKAIDNELTLTEFWHLVKHIYGFSMNKASAIFNYLGVSNKFSTKLGRKKETYGTQQHDEWYIKFL